MADLQCCLKFCCIAMWLSYTHTYIYITHTHTHTHIYIYIYIHTHTHIYIYIFFFLFSFIWFITGYWIQFLMLYSRTLLFVIPLFPQLQVLPSPTPFLTATACTGPFWFWMNSHISPANEKIPWYLPKEGNKPKNCAGSGYLWESHVRAQGDWCVFLTPQDFRDHCCTTF